jgi:hypothetical protein
VPMRTDLMFKKRIENANRYLSYAVYLCSP